MGGNKNKVTQYGKSMYNPKIAHADTRTSDWSYYRKILVEFVCIYRVYLKNDWKFS